MNGRQKRARRSVMCRQCGENRVRRGDRCSVCKRGGEWHRKSVFFGGVSKKMERLLSVSSRLARD